MKREYYSDSIANFLKTDSEKILGALATSDGFSSLKTQRDAWLAEISILKTVLHSYQGSIYFEYPRTVSKASRSTRHESARWCLATRR